MLPPPHAQQSSGGSSSWLWKRCVSHCSRWPLNHSQPTIAASSLYWRPPSTSHPRSTSLSQHGAIGGGGSAGGDGGYHGAGDGHGGGSGSGDAGVGDGGGGARGGSGGDGGGGGCDGGEGGGGGDGGGGAMFDPPPHVQQAVVASTSSAPGLWKRSLKHCECRDTKYEQSSSMNCATSVLALEPAPP